MKIYIFIVVVVDIFRLCISDTRLCNSDTRLCIIDTRLCNSDTRLGTSERSQLRSNLPHPPMIKELTEEEEEEQVYEEIPENKGGDNQTYLELS